MRQPPLPLRSPAELVALLHSELLYPIGTPKRSYKVLMELRARGVVVPSQFELDLLLSRLHVNDEWKLALRNMTVPTEQRCVLVPPVTQCVIPGCGGTDFVHARNGRSSQPSRNHAGLASMVVIAVAVGAAAEAPALTFSPRGAWLILVPPACSPQV